MSNSKAIIAAIVTGVGLVLIITLPIVLTLPESDPVKSFVDLVEGTGNFHFLNYWRGK